MLLLYVIMLVVRNILNGEGESYSLKQNLCQLTKGNGSNVFTLSEFSKISAQLHSFLVAWLLEMLWFACCEVTPGGLAASPWLLPISWLMKCRTPLSGESWHMFCLKEQHCSITCCNRPLRRATRSKSLFSCNSVIETAASWGSYSVAQSPMVSWSLPFRRWSCGSWSPKLSSNERGSFSIRRATQIRGRLLTLEKVLQPEDGSTPMYLQSYFSPGHVDLLKFTFLFPLSMLRVRAKVVLIKIVIPHPFLVMAANNKTEQNLQYNKNENHDLWWATGDIHPLHDNSFQNSLAY